MIELIMNVSDVPNHKVDKMKRDLLNLGYLVTHKMDSLIIFCEDTDDPNSGIADSFIEFLNSDYPEFQVEDVIQKGN